MTGFDRWRARSPYYDETHAAVAASVRLFVEREVAPHIDRWEVEGELPRSLHVAAATAGILGLGYPEEFGGHSDGFDIFHGMTQTEELCRVGAGGLGASLMTHGIGLPPILAMGSAELKGRIAPGVLAGTILIALGITEPSGGSDVANLKTRAVAKGDHYVVNGSKTFITTGMRADYLTTAVRTGGAGAGGVSLLLIPMNAAGVSRTRLDAAAGEDPLLDPGGRRDQGSGPGLQDQAQHRGQSRSLNSGFDTGLIIETTAEQRTHNHGNYPH